MKLEKLSAAAELISSVAIVVTLGYLAIQTRQNTVAIQATIRQAMLTDDREMLFQQIDHPSLVAARAGDAGLSDDELVQLASYLIASVRVRENQWLQFQNGVIDEQTWLTYRAALRAVFDTEFVRAWWRNRSSRGEFDEGFVAMLDDLLAQSPVRSSASVRERLGFDPL
jgi:hypothetical protein